MAILTAAAAALVAVAYIPVAASFSAANAGLVAAGRASGRVEGALLTDSPVAAYWSGKEPASVVVRPDVGETVIPAVSLSVLMAETSAALRAL